MTTPIASRRIAKQRIADRPIATRFGLEDFEEPQHFPPGSYTFRAPAAGYWKFVGWGVGGATTTGLPGGASGAYFEATRYLAVGQTAAIVVRDASVTTATTVTFADGTVASAGGANGGTAGTATITGLTLASDVLLNGTTGKTAGVLATGDVGAGSGGGAGGAGGGTDPGGAGAPAVLPYRGGNGGAGNTTYLLARGRSPGAGAGASGTPQSTPGGDGLVIASLVRE